MTWATTAPQGRHRASEPDTGDERTDTIAISALSATYGRHAARPGRPRLHLVVIAELGPAEDHAVALEPDAATGTARATSHPTRFFANCLWPRTMRRSA